MRFHVGRLHFIRAMLYTFFHIPVDANARRLAATKRIASVHYAASFEVWMHAGILDLFKSNNQSISEIHHD